MNRALTCLPRAARACLLTSAVLCPVGALGFMRALRWADPVLAVDVAYRAGRPDPWGQPRAVVVAEAEAPTPRQDRASTPKRGIVNLLQGDE